MSYVALDDRFAEHPKIAALTDREFRVHLRALCYCARNGTEGMLPQMHVIRGAKPKVVARLLELGVWQNAAGGPGPTTSGFEIHDYADYNGTRVQREQARERKRRQRQRERAAADELEQRRDSHGAGA